MNRIDLTGHRFGRLVAIKEAGYANNHSMIWECECDCGNIVFVTTGDLRHGSTKSCGCLRVDSSRKNAEKLYKWAQTNDLKEHTKLSRLSSTPTSANKSGVRGVSYDNKRRMWVAFMKFQSVVVLQDRFAKKEDAIRARREAEEKYFKPILKKYHRV